MSLEQRLRDTVQKLRRTPMPIADVAPLLQEAADEIDRLKTELKNLDTIQVYGHIRSMGG